MPKYSIARKESVLSKFLPPNNYSVAEISRQEGIGVQTLYAWRNKARRSGILMPSNPVSAHWDKQTKFTVVLETSAMNAQELSAYCREKGLYPDQVTAWREACMNGIDEPVIDAKAAQAQLRELKQAKLKLEQQLRRKDKALANHADGQSPYKITNQKI